MKQFFTLLTVLITTMFVNAQTYTLTDDDVVVTSGVIESCSYNFAIKDIIIPDNLDGQTVIGIADKPDDSSGVFRNKNILSVQLPSTLVNIGDWAFCHNKLTSVTIPNSVTSVGMGAFYSNHLTNVSIPNNVTFIGEEAFEYNNITSVTFDANSSIRGIGKSAFYGNYDLSAITLPTHANTSFVNYSDDNGNTYAPGETISNFSTPYYVNIPYTLTDDDVVVTDGVIESCSYNFASKIIIIPETLDGQTVIGIIGNDNYYAGVFHKKGIKTVKLPPSLEYIGSGAFIENKLTSITIPGSVTTIEMYAFAGNYLDSVSIPNSVALIGAGAFKYNSLTNVTFEANSNILTILEEAFDKNTGLSAVTMPTHANTSFVNYTDGNGNTYAAGETISDFITLYYVNIPYTLTDDDVVVTDGVIESCSYSFVSKIITIPETLDGQTITGIADKDNYQSGVFSYKNILTVQLPSTLVNIGNWAFGRNNLTSITIPNSVTYIGDCAFRSNSLASLNVSNSVIYIGYSAFRYNSLTSVTFEGNSNILTIEKYAFDENANLSAVTMPTHANTNFYTYYDGNGNTYAPGETITDFNTVYYTNIPYTLTDDDVVVTDGVIESCSYNFASKIIIIPETLDGQTVTGIADKAGYTDGVFSSKGIRIIQLPPSLEYIGDWAFHRNNLTSIIIPNSVTNIGRSAFDSNSLESISISNNVVLIGDMAFCYNNLTSVTIPNSVTFIGNHAFRVNSLTSVTFEANSNILGIGRTAFKDNPDLSDIILPTHANTSFVNYSDDNGNTYAPGETITDFDTHYYANIPYTLTDDDVVVIDGVIDSCSYNFASKIIIIPEILDGQTVIGIADKSNYRDGVFSYKYILTIQLPSTLEYIGDRAFYRNSLTSIIIPNSVTNIGRSAFGSNFLDSVSIPNNVALIGDAAFYNNNLISVTIPNSVTYIGDYAFLDNSLTSVTFEANSNILGVGEAAFYDNPDLSVITLPTHANTSFVNYSDDNGNTYAPGETISDFDTHYYANIPYTLTDDDVVVTNGVIDSCSYNFASKIIIIPETLDGQTVTGIADKSRSWDGVFSYKYILTIQLPSTLENIGDYALSGNNLTSIIIPNSVTNIGTYAFGSNSLDSVSIPNNVVLIEDEAFSGNNLTSVTFEANSNILGIGKYAFYGNSDLSDITLPTHASSNFVEYKDENGTSYNSGDNITDFSILYEVVITVATHTVTFNDWDGTELKTETIEHGNAATAPADPTRAGYTFTGWDTAFDNVIADLTVTAQYELNTSIEDITNTVLSIYPNPAHNFVFVESSGLEMKSIQIFAITGKLIKTVRPDAQNIRLDVSDLTNGVYFVKVETGNRNKVVKLVKR